VEGLGILVCDASASMDNQVFKNERKDLTKLQLVAGAVRSALLQMLTLSNNDRAYIAIIMFGERAKVIQDRQGRPFVRSVRELINEFGVEPAYHMASALGKQWAHTNPTPEQARQQEEWIKEAFNLDHFLHEQLKDDVAGFGRDGTNITEALSLARQITDAAIAGSLSAFGVKEPVSLKMDDIPRPGEKSIRVPNVRVMIYSDGEHNRGRLENAFASMQPASVLLTAFIDNENESDDTRKGADQMLACATICPEHKEPGYFLINTLGRRTYLREVFHMATGSSGFCRQCMKGGAVVQI
jgi:hypothetical protein